MKINSSDLNLFEKLNNEVRKIAGISPRNVLRAVLSLLQRKESDVEGFCKLLLDARLALKKCLYCQGPTESSICNFCADVDRNFKEICVVATWLELLAIRDVAMDYQGQFFVLGGLLSPLDGVLVDDLAIPELLKCIEQKKVEKLIFAFSPTPEGEITVNYVKGVLQENKDLEFWKIASGVPVGSNLEFVDRSTMLQAFSEKRQF